LTWAGSVYCGEGRKRRAGHYVSPSLRPFCLPGQGLRECPRPQNAAQVSATGRANAPSKCRPEFPPHSGAVHVQTGVNMKRWQYELQITLSWISGKLGDGFDKSNHYKDGLRAPRQATTRVPIPRAIDHHWRCGIKPSTYGPPPEGRGASLAQSIEDRYA
jgi:hypothetical protein